MTFLNSGSLVFSVPSELSLTKYIRDQKNIPQIILKERTAHLASYTLLQKLLINIETCHFHSSINQQEHLFHSTLITSYFCPVNIAKFLRKTILKNTSRSRSLQMFSKTQTQVFFLEVCEILKNTFFYRTSPVPASAPAVAASVFF